MRTVIAVLLLIVAPRSAVEAQTLLPTEALSEEVRQLLDPKVLTMENVSDRRMRGEAARDRIAKFIVGQLEAMPSVSQRQLEAQLRAITCRNSDECDTCTEPPFVFTNSWGPRTTRRQVVVAYPIHLNYHGHGGTITVIESYLWENGRARRTSSAGNEFDGYAVNFEQIAWHPADFEYWILAWGTLTGSSGRGLGGRAAVYRVGVQTVETVWIADLLNVRAQRSDLGWEVAYSDRDRLYGNLPQPSVLDIYAFDYSKKTSSRVIHYRH